MDKNVKIFALVGAFATLMVTIVSIIAIMREASWASTGIIIGIIAATITIIVPVAQSISLRFKHKGTESTEVVVGIQSRATITDTAPAILPRDDKQKTQEMLTVLVVRSRPGYLYQALGKDPKKTKKRRKPQNVTEHKPEVITEVEPDNLIIQRAFDQVGKRALIKSLEGVTKADLASALGEKWDIVHFDCVVGSQGQLFLEDGQIQPQTLKELLASKGIKLLVLMDCDSVKVVSTAASAGIGALIAVTGSLPILVAEKFCKTLYSGLAKGYNIGQAFINARTAASVEFEGLWDPNLFFVDGDQSISF